MSLDELKTRLLYNDVIDVWLAYAREKGVPSIDPDRFRRFTVHLTSRGVDVRELSVCISAEGEKGQLAKAVYGKSEVRTRVVKLDSRTLQIVREFDP